MGTHSARYNAANSKAWYVAAKIQQPLLNKYYEPAYTCIKSPRGAFLALG